MIITNILLIIIILELGFNIWMCFTSPPEDKKLEIKNGPIKNETIIMDWQPEESDEQTAFKESIAKLEEIRKNEH